MNDRKTWDEMRAEYPDQWLLITDIEKDEWGNLKSGVVVRHSANREEVYKKPSLDKPTAFRYTGESNFSGLRCHVQVADSV
jgi:hypothetical protein